MHRKRHCMRRLRRQAPPERGSLPRQRQSRMSHLRSYGARLIPLVLFIIRCGSAGVWRENRNHRRKWIRASRRRPKAPPLPRPGVHPRQRALPSPNASVMKSRLPRQGRIERNYAGAGVRSALPTQSWFRERCVFRIALAAHAGYFCPCPRSRTVCNTIPIGHKNYSSKLHAFFTSMLFNSHRWRRFGQPHGGLAC